MLASFDALLRAVDRASRCLAWLGGVLLLGMVLLIAVEIVMRRTVGTSPGLSYEYSGYVLGISASWSFAYALFHKAHIRIDAAYVRFAPKGRIGLDMLALAAMAAFAAMTARASVGVLAETLARDTVSNSPLHTPMWIPQILWVGGWLWFAFAVLLLLARCAVALALGDPDTVRRLAGSSTLDEQIEDEAPDLKEV